MVPGIGGFCVRLLTLVIRSVPSASSNEPVAVLARERLNGVRRLPGLLPRSGREPVGRLNARVRAAGKGQDTLSLGNDLPEPALARPGKSGAEDDHERDHCGNEGGAAALIGHVPWVVDVRPTYFMVQTDYSAQGCHGSGAIPSVSRRGRR
jgi:hypothetical protein